MSKKKKKDYDGSNQKAAYFFFSQAFFVCSTKTQEEASEELSGVVVAGVVSMSKLREWQYTRNGCQKLWFEADLYQIASRAFHILLKKNVVVLFWSSLDCLGLLFQKNCLEAAAVKGGRVE